LPGTSIALAESWRVSTGLIFHFINNGLMRKMRPAKAHAKNMVSAQNLGDEAGANGLAVVLLTRKSDK